MDIYIFTLIQYTSYATNFFHFREKKNLLTELHNVEMLRFDLRIPMQNTATPNNRIPQRSVQLHSIIVGALSMMHRVPFMHTCPTGIIHWVYCNFYRYNFLPLPEPSSIISRGFFSRQRTAATKKTCAISRTNPKAIFALFLQTRSIVYH